MKVKITQGGDVLETSDFIAGILNKPTDVFNPQESVIEIVGGNYGDLRQLRKSGIVVEVISDK